eukprot:2378506-Amphidinium_carterae.1
MMFVSLLIQRANNELSLVHQMVLMDWTRPYWIVAVSKQMVRTSVAKPHTFGDIATLHSCGSACSGCIVAGHMHAHVQMIKPNTLTTMVCSP